MTTLIPLDLNRASLVNRYLAAHPPEVSELTFTNLFVWRRGRPIWLAELDATLVFLCPAGGDRGEELVIFGPPAGPLPLPEIFRHLEGRVVGAVRQSAASVAGLDAGRFTVVADRKDFDYVYRVADLADLAGRDYSAKRNLIKQCLKNYDCRFETITAANLKECRDLLSRWCDARHCRLDRGLSGEWAALKEALSLFSDFHLFGGLIRIDGAVEAFAIGERLNTDTAVCHFEKSIHTVKGLGQLINQWFARHCLRDFTFVNREQDLGIPGLRQAKESYHPHHLVEKFTVDRK